MTIRKIEIERLSVTSSKPFDVVVAALPLTAIMAYEVFFDRLDLERIGRDAGQRLLICRSCVHYSSVIRRIRSVREENAH